MKTILCATDMSQRAELAVDRAASLARQFNANLRLLHVVDDDQPPDLVHMEVARARDVLHVRIGDLNSAAALEVESEVKPGGVFQTIVTTAQTSNADLVVMGAHRKRVLKDVIIGTTIERVMRTGSHPVLMVNAAPTNRYDSVLLALDASKASARAAGVAKGLELLEDVRLSVVCAFEPAHKGMLEWVGAESTIISKYSEVWANKMRDEIRNLLQDAGIHDESIEILMDEGPAFLVVDKLVTRLGSQLLVIGTHGRTGVKRALLGSVAEWLISRVNCDVLVVPSSRTE